MSAKFPRGGNSFSSIRLTNNIHARIQRWEVRGQAPPLLYGFLAILSNTGSDPMNNHKATELAFNVGPLNVKSNDVLPAGR